MVKSGSKTVVIAVLARVEAVSLLLVSLLSVTVLLGSTLAAPIGSVMVAGAVAADTFTTSDTLLFAFTVPLEKVTTPPDCAAVKPPATVALR